MTSEPFWVCTACSHNSEVFDMYTRAMVKFYLLIYLSEKELIFSVVIGVNNLGPQRVSPLRQTQIPFVVVI